MVDAGLIARVSPRAMPWVYSRNNRMQWCCVEYEPICECTVWPCSWESYIRSPNCDRHWFRSHAWPLGPLVIWVSNLKIEIPSACYYGRQGLCGQDRRVLFCQDFWRVRSPRFWARSIWRRSCKCHRPSEWCLCWRLFLRPLVPLEHF